MSASALNAEQLQSAFAIFNQHSSQLEQSYRELQDTVELLTTQLSEARSARVTELVKKERLSHRLTQLLETLPGAIVVIDGDGVIQEHNSEAVSLLGKPLSGSAWADIVKREIRDGGSEDGNIQLRDGRWLGLSRRPLPDEPGEILLLADVTESRQISELRQRRERLTAIGEMTAEFAHQVRTPLASAMLYASQLQSTATGQQRVIEKIGERLNDLGRMVNDMLSFASGGRRSDDILNVHTMFENIANTLRPQLAEGTSLVFLVDGSDVEQRTDENLPFTLAGNADALKGALANLVLNADQAGAKNIHVGAWQDDVSVYFTVTDDGPGISPDIASHLFEPFFTTRPQGTGLGLAVVRAVARAHGGDVDVEQLQNGCRFTLHLPDVLDSLKENSYE
jgi:two-component system sensor histidine kinase FlrB